MTFHSFKNIFIYYECYVNHGSSCQFTSLTRLVCDVFVHSDLTPLVDPLMTLSNLTSTVRMTPSYKRESEGKRERVVYRRY